MFFLVKKGNVAGGRASTAPGMVFIPKKMDDLPHIL